MKRTFLRLGRWLHIYADHLGDYMSRWVVQHPWGTVRLHHILRSDEGLDLHDHPWDFTSIVLRGGYREWTTSTWEVPGFSDAPFYGPGSILRRKAENLHRLVLTEPAWTLVLSGPKRRRWGFYTPTGWVYWRTYHRVGEEWHQERVGEVPDVG